MTTNVTLDNNALDSWTKHKLTAWLRGKIFLAYKFIHFSFIHFSFTRIFEKLALTERSMQHILRKTPKIAEAYNIHSCFCRKLQAIALVWPQNLWPNKRKLDYIKSNKATSYLHTYTLIYTSCKELACLSRKKLCLISAATRLRLKKGHK